MFVHGAPSDHERQAAGKFDQHVRGVRDVAIERDFARAGGTNAARKLRIAGGEHERIEPVRQQVADDARVVGVILVP